MMRALLAATFILAVAGGCWISPGTGSAGSGSGGSGGTGGTGAANCRALGGTDCYCSSAGANTLSECSGDSVAVTDHGYCCSGGGFCTCFRTACVSLASIGFCDCSSPIDTTSPRVDICPQATGGTCCLDTGLIPYDCHCSASVTSCRPEETQVPSCSLADVMKCDTNETVVDRCK
jgi:hypothetical protein